MILLVAIVSSTFAARAQESDHAKNKPKPYALLFGTVWNAEGMPVYGVEVQIRRADHKHTQWTQVSDHHGEFAQRVPPGTADYIVTAEVKVKEGKKKAKQTAETKVHIDNDERVDFGLHLTE
jgi:hypothetical protein